MNVVLAAPEFQKREVKELLGVAEASGLPGKQRRRHVNQALVAILKLRATI